MPTKVWAVGEEALAADMNTYVQQQVIAQFANLAALKSAWPSPPDGAHAYLLDEFSELVARGGTWRWQKKVFPAASGNTAVLTWAAAAVAASSSSQLTIVGRSVRLWVLATLTTPGTASSGTLATIAAPYRLATIRADCGAVGATSTGGAVGRGYVDSGGAVGHQFTGAPASMSSIYLQTEWATPDLIAA